MNGYHKVKEGIDSAATGLVSMVARGVGAIDQRTYEETIDSLASGQLGQLSGMAYHNAKAMGQSETSALYQSVGYLGASVVGLTGMYESVTDQNTITLENYNRDGWEQTGDFSFGFGQFTGTVALASGLTMQTGAAIGQIGRSTLESMTLTDTMGPSPINGLGTKVSAVEGLPVRVQQGTIVNRVWDSAWTEGAQGLSGPIGRSYSPGSALPISSDAAVASRGLNIYSGNNAGRGAITECCG